MTTANPETGEDGAHESGHDEVWRERVERALAKVRRARLVGPIRAMPGGHSGVTLMLDLEQGDALIAAVVKAAPFGREPRGRHDVLRQARIMGRLRAAGFLDIPEILLVDESAPPLFVMEMLVGEAVEPSLDDPNDLLDPVLLASRARTAVECLARLHAAGPQAIRDEVPTRWDPRTEIERWTALLRAADSPLAVLIGEVGQPGDGC